MGEVCGQVGILGIDVGHGACAEGEALACFIGELLEDVGEEEVHGAGGSVWFASHDIEAPALLGPTGGDGGDGEGVGVSGGEGAEVASLGRGVEAWGADEKAHDAIFVVGEPGEVGGEDGVVIVDGVEWLDVELVSFGGAVCHLSQVSSRLASEGEGGGIEESFRANGDAGDPGGFGDGDLFGGDREEQDPAVSGLGGVLDEGAEAFCGVCAGAVDAADDEEMLGEGGVGQGCALPDGVVEAGFEG